MRPIGDRVLIRPEAQAEETDSGLALVEHKKPATAGTVVSVGTGEHPLRKEAADLVPVLDEIKDLLYSEHGGYQTDLSQVTDVLLKATQRVPEVKPGDYVVFSWQAGQELWVDDEQLLIMRESDILAVIED